MVSSIVSALDKKFETRLNTFYTFTASALAWVAIVSGGKAPLHVLSQTGESYFGTRIPWFDAAQRWLDDRSWLAPELCTVFVVLAAIAIASQGSAALASRTAATMWLLVVLGVSRGANVFIVVVLALVVVLTGGALRQRRHHDGGVPFEAVLLGLLEAPFRVLSWLCGHIKQEDEPQDVRIVSQVHTKPASGARVVRS